ncbi:DUF2306 domain-containing protein [Spirosoma oryzicola]|uniref:DUF2306 domain-containing protein n=1 Tax=Spirosoma oryzicola TaxID=2898794 RepID=UPI001E419C25|nr:DUF2306 domain-containing protein [Spirosoma oryzicola]UHG93784.1 DUF2306 domain-containing protein [Spirosoma oryzicola]
MISSNDLPQPTRGLDLSKLSRTLLRWSSRILVITVWVSAFLFGFYILAFYAAALYQGDMQRWNGVLPRLYESKTATATTGIGLHFAAGGIILILGSIQLLDSVRIRFPALHRWVGRLYIGACLLAAVGGLVFIALKGTIGGPVMSIGFGLYGLLMGWSALETYRHAIRRQLEQHRIWALRLYALAIGSWLYRMDYGFWLLLTDGLGHTRTFSGPFDQVMAFFFYIPNLLVVEAVSRAGAYRASTTLKLLTSSLLLLATVFLGVGTYYFTRYYWGPAILTWLGAA